MECHFYHDEHAGLRSDGTAVTSHIAAKEQKINAYIGIIYTYNELLKEPFMVCPPKGG